MYAIVDIETTGSPKEINGITEIAVILHNGKKIEGKYQTLINPGRTIPPYVAHLTGISNNMVAAAPSFYSVADKIYKLLEGRIFVAHNAGFDFPFVEYFLKKAGFELQSDILCTLKLSKKAFPNLPKHGLSTLCELLDIDPGKHHRAGDDAMATALLLDLILKHSGERLVRSMIKTIAAKSY